MGEALIWDVESNGLLQEATKLHTIQCGTAEGEDVTVYCDALPGYPSIAEGLKRLSAADKLIGQNVVNFDLPLLEKLHPGTVRLEQMIDTLLLARLMDPTERLNSLAAWGERLGVRKGDYEGPWDVCTQAMLDYAAQDVITTRALWNHTKHVMEWSEKLIDVEHKFAWVIHRMEQNGFTLNVQAAQALDAELRGDLATIERDLQAAFPPLERTETFTPKANNKARGYVKGVPFIKRRLEPFNPASRHHVAERLKLLGWSPKEFTPDGHPKVDETTLNTLPWPQARLMVRYFTVLKALGQLSDGKQGWLKLVRSTGRVHGRVNTIGCAPGRCAHNSPNMAQVSKKDRRMREVWIPRSGWRLVGVDGEGLQARALAHYLHRFDGGAFAKRVHEGSKKDRTDVHSANLAELSRARVILVPLDAAADVWDKGRDGSKRCLYACWFGARDRKLGWTAKDGAKNAGLPVPKVPDTELGKLARVALNRAITGFDKLSDQIQRTAKERGYLISPLGRHVPIRSPHSALVFLMQAVESDTMKTAAVLFHFEVAPARGWVEGRDFAYCAHVHDEAELECRPEIADELGQAYADCITEAGVRLGLRCPLAGSPHVGDSWSAVH